MRVSDSSRQNAHIRAHVYVRVHVQWVPFVSKGAPFVVCALFPTASRTHIMSRQEEQDEQWRDHCQWLAEVRAQYEQLSAHASHEQPEQRLHERFNDALDFDAETSVYRGLSGGSSTSGSMSMTGGLAWQPSYDDEVDVDEPVYRSLGGFAGAQSEVEVEGSTTAAQTMPTSHAAWMQSMPPLVTRQRAFHDWS